MRKSSRRSPTARWTRKSAIAWCTALFIEALALQAAQAAPVPDFKLQLFNGKTTSLQEHRGRPVLVNFFYSK